MTIGEQDIKKVISATVRETLMELGLDAKDPIEMQKDFAHLRAWRESTEEIKSKGLLALVIIAFTGLAGIIWTSIKASLH